MGIDFDAFEVALKKTWEVEEQAVGGLQILDPLGEEVVSWVVVEEEVAAVQSRHDLFHIAPVVAAAVVVEPADAEIVEHAVVFAVDDDAVVASVGGGFAAAAGNGL